MCDTNCSERFGTDISSTIKSIMVEKSISQIQMTELLGMKSQAGVSQALNRDMKIPMILRFLEALDCELIVKNGDREFLIK